MIYGYSLNVCEVEETSSKQKNYIKRNMKLHLFIFTLLLAAIVVLAYQPPVRKPPPGGWKPFPTFPGHGPFNPKIKFPY
ncbi:hypothetical protein PUN28_013744 [Cardiocondyla obscurior]|uniref:Abaecin n=1 Tax=Cardiocondyla obscurior TaxID=286306 RepID=A0AAW2F504_9HYME